VLDRIEEQNRQLRTVTAEVLALICELRKGTIDRIMGVSDIELGLSALGGSRSAPDRTAYGGFGCLHRAQAAPASPDGRRLSCGVRAQEQPRWKPPCCFAFKSCDRRLLAL